jgi:addiction module RelE/StbE family toxin
MQIHYTSRFKKRFNKLPQKIQQVFEKKLRIFILDIHEKTLRTHKLKGNLSSFFAFSITRNYRVIFQILSRTLIVFVDIGTHNQVY